MNKRTNEPKKKNPDRQIEGPTDPPTDERMNDLANNIRKNVLPFVEILPYNLIIKLRT